MIIIRGHHLLCIPRFYRGGYTEEFADNMKKICMQIRDNPDIKIKVIKGCDDICDKCYHKKNNLCKRTPKFDCVVLRWDENVFKKFDIKENSIHKAKDIFNLSMNKVNNGMVTENCKGCPHKKNCLKVGINNSFRRDINKK